MIDVIPYIVLGVVMAGLAVAGIVIASGHGDRFIAGYNTASAQERDSCNVKRLRLIVAVACWISALSMLLISQGFWGSMAAVLIIFLASNAGIILANTWAKHK